MSEKLKQTKVKYHDRCANCVCLVSNGNGDWICDEVDKLCAEVTDCPEERKHDSHD